MKPLQLKSSVTTRFRSARWSRRPRQLRRRAGSTLVEFALILPVLIAVIIGIMEFGWMVYNNMTIANGAREGARLAALGSSPWSVRSLVDTRVLPLNVSTSVQHSIDGGVTYVNTNAVGSTSNGSNTATLPNDAPFGALMRVTVVLRYRPLTGFFPFLNNRDIRAKAEFGRE